MEPIEPTFLEGSDPTRKIDNLPFDHAWIRDGFNGRDYTKLYVEDIRSDLLPEKAWLRSTSLIITSKEDYDTEAKKIAEHFKERLLKDLKEYKDTKVVLVEAPDKETITMEIALTELEFSHPGARTAALVSPVPGTGAALGSMSDPHVAFAARFNDPEGKLAVTLADRAYPPSRIVDFNKMTVTSSPNEVVQRWSEVLAESINNGKLVKTDRSSRFSLLPW